MSRPRLRKRWPNPKELIAWWIWYKIKESPLHDLDDPEVIRDWLEEAGKMTHTQLHQFLYQFNDFRIEFSPPPPSLETYGVGIGRTRG